MTAPPLALSTKAIELRPEARPLPFADLDDQQSQAFLNVVDLLFHATEAVQQASGSANQRPSASFGGAHLPTRSILVDGARGTGKSTLLLTLEEALKADGNGLSPDRGFDLRELPQQSVERITSLRHRLIWLETLDMEPLSRDVSLLGAVLARVEHAVGGPALERPSSAASALLCPLPEYHDVLRELARLQTSVARTFEGNLAQRAGRLDPDSFAIESRRGERERLGLGRCFRDVLGELSRTFHGGRHWQTPLFVLPVDDLDLNLRESLAFLRLLQAAQSPHLAVIMAADLELLSSILRLEYQGELAEIARPVELEDHDRRLAEKLAAEILRKHLPPTQRIRMGLADPPWALDFRPVPGARRLRELLGGLQLPADEAVLHTDPRFRVAPAGLPPQGSAVTSVGTPLPPSEERRVRAVITGYSWPEALRVPTRQVTDLYLSCGASEAERHGGVEGDPEEGLREFARDRLREWASGLPSGRDEMEFMVRPRVSRPPRRVNDRTVVMGYNWQGWAVLRSGVTLPPDESAAFVGCFELADDWDRPWQITPTMQPLRETRLPTHDAGQPIVIPWPWVNHSTFWGYERAVKWLAEAEKQWARQPYPDFGSWIAVMTTQLFDVKEDVEHPLDKPLVEPATNWEGLRKHLGDLLATPDPDLTREWLLAVGLLCTPEMGMNDPGQPPRQIVPADAELAESIEQLRAQRHQDLQRAGVVDLPALPGERP